MEPDWHSSAFILYLGVSSVLKRQSCTWQKQGSVNEMLKPALVHSPVQGGKDEELSLAGCEDSKSAVSQAGELGRLQPPLRFIDRVAKAL